MSNSMFSRHLGHPVVGWRPVAGTSIDKAAVDVCELVAAGTGACVLLYNGFSIAVERQTRPGEIVDEYERRIKETESHKRLEDVVRIACDAIRCARGEGIHAAMKATRDALEIAFPGYRFNAANGGFDIKVAKKDMANAAEAR